MVNGGLPEPRPCRTFRAMSQIDPAPSQPTGGRYASFEAFYPFYIHEHSNRTCRRIHVAGTSLVILAFVTAILTGNPWWFAAMPLVGYGFAWIGHFFFEKNTPATFKYPLWSLMGDFRLFFETVIGKRRW